jgi:hypothetical protein
MLGSRRGKFWSLLAVPVLAVTTGCAYQAPTIAHIHLGHTITGVEGTPGEAGFLTVAEQSSQTALDHANKAVTEGQSLDEIKTHVAAANQITNIEEETSLKHAVDHAMDHVRFAVESEDASDNVRESYENLKPISEGIFYRSNLIQLFAEDLGNTSSQEDARFVAEQVQQLTYANRNGEDLDDDGEIGSQPREFGMVQIQAEIDAMIAREDPPYVAVDRWYLFNLIRLPDGKWIFRPAGSSAARGY